MGIKIIKKILLILLFLIMFLNYQTITVYADGENPTPAASDSTGSAAINEWWSPSDNTYEKSPVTKSMDIMGAALNITQIVAVGIIILMGMVLGCKFMISSIEDRAEIKKHLIAYFVGTIIVLCAIAIVNVVRGVALTLYDS